MLRPDPEMMLKVKGLTCGYDKFLLQDINFDVKRGEFLGIIGPNGSGKTTLLKAITRVLKLRYGEVLLEGRSINHYTFQELARRIAVVSQDVESAGLNLTAIEYVLLGRIPFMRRFQFLETNEDKKIAFQMMEKVGILNLALRSISEMSGGERQCAVIARALAQEPQILFLDEPTMHLDIGHQVRILDLLKRLNKEDSLTVVVVLHDLNLASLYCDRLVLLKEGRVHSIGTPEEILTYPVIEEVYKTLVVVEKNPVTSKPLICLVPEAEKEGSGLNI